jgi:hypothetical protein
MARKACANLEDLGPGAWPQDSDKENGMSSESTASSLFNRTELHFHGRCVCRACYGRVLIHCPWCSSLEMSDVTCGYDWPVLVLSWPCSVDQGYPWIVWDRLERGQ